jgi:hypothetical protein
MWNILRAKKVNFHDFSTLSINQTAHFGKDKKLFKFISFFLLAHFKFQLYIIRLQNISKNVSHCHLSLWAFFVCVFMFFQRKKHFYMRWTLTLFVI